MHGSEFEEAWVSELDGRVAVVSGGSRGLGRAISQALAAAGARVVVNFAHSAEPAEHTRQLIRDRGGEAVVARGDVTTHAGATDVIDAARREFGAVDILVNNAVGPQPPLAVDETGWDEHVDQLRFAVAAPVHLGRAALPDLRRSPAGRIINIGSEVTARPAASQSAYTTAKAAMVGLTRSWATELGGQGITVNLVAPGFVPVARHAEVGADERAAYVGDVPLDRMGEPADIAEAVRFLASDRAAFMTGQVLGVNGGRTFGP